MSIPFSISIAIRHGVHLEPTSHAIIKLYSPRRLSPFLCLKGLGVFRGMRIEIKQCKKILQATSLLPAPDANSREKNGCNIRMVLERNVFAHTVRTLIKHKFYGAFV